MVAVGSIVDLPIYKNRKSSRVGKVHTDAYGCFGGGPVTDASRLNTVNSDVTLHGDDRVLRWEVGAVSECGIRDSNEDAYLIANDLIKAFDTTREVDQENSNHTSTIWTQSGSHQPGLFAIFDGHCENQAARYAAEKVLSFIFDESMEIPVSDEKPGGVQDIEGVLLRAMLNLDDSFCHLCTSDGRNWDSGSTALVAVIAHEHLVLANLGDCRGVVSRSVASSSDGSVSCYADHTVLQSEGWTQLELDDDEDKWIRATGDGAINADNMCLWKEIAFVHAPSRDEERRRIEDAGGWLSHEIEIPISQFQRMDFCDEDVIEILKRCFSDRYHSSQELTPSKRGDAAPRRIIDIWRVCGELAVSRALGDRDFKAAFNTLTESQIDEDSKRMDGPCGSWDGPEFLVYPDKHNRRFVGDLVSSVPEVQALKVGQKGVFDEFVVLACDGLWDVMDPDDAVRVARGLLFEKKWSAKKAVSFLFLSIISQRCGCF